MASPKSVIKSQLELGGNLLEQFAKDLSDAEYFQAPSDGTNHAGWLLGHIACTEDWGMATLSGNAMKYDQSMRDLFDGGTTCHADASKYPSRQEIDTMFRDARATTMESLAAFDESRWDAPSPDGAPVDFFPTLGSLWGMMATHQFWHLGQLASCRTVLKKPRLLM